jgi:MFS family permease
LFIAVALIGYVVYLLMTAWWVAFAGLALVMVWDSMASPTLFAVVGDALPKHMRTMGFTVQSVLRRVPIVIAPIAGGILVSAIGIQRGVRAGLVVSIVLAGVTLAVASQVRLALIPDEAPTNVREVWKKFPDSLRWLLASDIFIRTCEAMVDVFLVIYAVNVLRISPSRFGIVVAVQALSAILVYVPAAKIAERTGKKPFVIATFVAFAAFPLSVVWATSFGWLVAAFVVGGLREIGEPARKALILDLAAPSIRARVVGLYYFARSVAIAPAAFVGGLLWKVSPALPFYVAAAAGAVGVAVFSLTVDEQHAG